MQLLPSIRLVLWPELRAEAWRPMSGRGGGQGHMLRRQEATQTFLVLLSHPLCLPRGKKPGSWARGKLGGNVCERGKDVAQEMAALCLDSPTPRSHPGPQRCPERAFLEVLECGMPAPALLFYGLPFFFFF